MKSLFGRKKEKAVINDNEIDFDMMEDDAYIEEDSEEYYEEGEYTEEGSEVYYEEGEYTEEGAEEYYEEGEYTEEGAEEYYEEGEYTEEGAEEYYEEGEYTGEDSEEYYEEDEYTQEDSEAFYEGEISEGDTQILPEISLIADEENWNELDVDDDSSDEENDGRSRRFSLIDGIIAGTGAAVVVLAILVMVLFFDTKANNEKGSMLAEVGQSLKNVELIGGKGIEAVANAALAKREQETVEEQPTDPEEDTNTDYVENDYSTTYAVSMSLTSVQKDLKIKFSNRETGKLIANVPFKANITLPDGTSQSWSDDDMDGVIYAKNLEAGAYKVKLESLENQKYSNYILPSASQSVEVKKKIEYQKVEVKDEIKKESEVNVAAEDTKKNETEVESTLTDTVEWMASTATSSTYSEILKDKIPDPYLVLLQTPLQPVAATSQFDRTSLSLMEGQTANLTVNCTDDEGNFTVNKIEYASVDENVVKIIASSGNVVTVQAVSAGNPTQIYYAISGTIHKATAENPELPDEPVVLQGSCLVTVTRKSSVVLSKASSDLGMGQTDWIQASVPADYDAPQGVTYSLTIDEPSVVNAVVSDAGVVTIAGIGAGDAKVTIYANKAGGNEETKISAVISVKVTEKRVLKLDKSQVITFAQDAASAVVLHATVENPNVADTPIVALSSDESVATATVENKEIKIVGLKTGSAIITVVYKEPTDSIGIVTTCAVTVFVHPKDDKTTKLTDADGNPIYILENDEYREAVYADYYTADKFFVMKGVKYTGWQTIDNQVYYFNTKGEPVTGEQIIQGAKYNFASDGSLVTGSGVLGIDVSKWNGNIDWAAVKSSGVSYVIIRCGYRGSSQGMLIEDSKFTKNIQGAIGAGLKVGVYFFSQAIDEVEAVYEASYVLEKIKGYKISYPIFLDVEPSGGRADKIDKATRTAVCKAFCQTVQNAGYTAGVYANRNWLEEMLDPSALSGYKIWLAQYAKEPTYKGHYDMWQYKSTGTITGISGNVDMNMSYLGY